MSENLDIIYMYYIHFIYPKFATNGIIILYYINASK